MQILFCVGKSYVSIHRQMADQLEAMGAHVRCLMYDQALNKELIKKSIRECEICITAIAPCDREVIEAAPNLRYILKTGTGLDNVAINDATARGILVSNAPGGNATSVAEMAFGQLISLSRMIPMLDRGTKKGEWPSAEAYELDGKTIGIIGFGSIGQKVARFAGGFNMRVIAFGNYQDQDAARRLRATFVDLDRLLREADYIVISTALSSSNYHLIDQYAIDKMKTTAFLINISRGALIDEPVLFEALKKRRLAGAALDVFEQEPPESLPNLDNLIASPHVAGTTRESIARVAHVTVENVRKFMNHEQPDFVVNTEALRQNH
ncbi:glycerate dehydrogenase [Sporolactobacillus shoreicorticis]|uniref:NAD(P)-dependent oxidoreductase n=1 Tax=Sporolactobacillus shoreicorticis TaxID=1923877 RepID=A0ABW5S4R2_9BACL|nr:NAD(P)-dependent oxidoreductase [Sporolactobacillus shoreicorticis]MCO7127544.1 glycerate dehydrogenase [Sporolactobacillus shoreicorticis]